MAMTRRHAGITRAAAGGSIHHARKDAVRGRKENRSRKQNPECVHDFIIQERGRAAITAQAVRGRHGLGTKDWRAC
jgi:hypothetical protein